MEGSTPNYLLIGSNLAGKAVQADTNKEYPEAIEYYSQAVNCLTKALASNERKEIRHSIRTNAEGYQVRMLELKSLHAASVATQFDQKGNLAAAVQAYRESISCYLQLSQSKKKPIIIK